MNLWLVRQVHQTHTVTVLESTTHAPTRTALRADCKGGSLLPRLIPRYLHLTQHLPRSVQFVGASTPGPGSRKIMDSCTQASHCIRAGTLHVTYIRAQAITSSPPRWQVDGTVQPKATLQTPPILSYLSRSTGLPSLAPYEFFSGPLFPTRVSRLDTSGLIDKSLKARPAAHAAYFAKNQDFVVTGLEMFSGHASLGVHSHLALRAPKVHRVQSGLSPLEWADIITGDSAAASTQQLPPGSQALRTRLRRTAKYTPLLVWLGTPPRYQPNESTDGWVGSYT
jgi:hypothetical protein